MGICLSRRSHNISPALEGVVTRRVSRTPGNITVCLSPSGSFFDVFGVYTKDVLSSSTDSKRDEGLTEEAVSMEPQCKEADLTFKEWSTELDKLLLGESYGYVGLVNGAELKPDTKPSELCKHCGAKCGLVSLKAEHSKAMENAKALETGDTDMKKSTSNKCVRFNDEVEVFILPDEEVEVCDAIDEKLINEIETEYGIYMTI